MNAIYRGPIFPPLPALATRALPPMILPLSILLLLLGVLGPNPGISLLFVLILVAGSALLWRPGESPILLFTFFVQWLQGALLCIFSNLLNEPIQEMSLFGGNVRLASILTVVSVFFLALGLRIGAGPRRSSVIDRCRKQAASLSPRSWVQLYVVLVLVGIAATEGARLVPGLSQPLLALAQLRWMAYCGLTYTTFAGTDTDKGWWLGITGCEFLYGLGGYNSTFKTVLIFATLAAVAAIRHVSSRRLVMVGSLCMIAILMSVVWTAIKPAYRTFVLGDRPDSTITASWPERISEINRLISHIELRDLQIAAVGLVNRIANVDYFGNAINWVPNAVPFQKGKIWLNAIERPFTPRILFPGKSILDDSAETNTFTGLAVAGRAEGTSITIGYPAESYIDFGEYGMMVVVFVFGVFLGGLYKAFFYSTRTPGIFGMGFATCVLMNAYEADTAAKLVGGVVTSALVAWLAGPLLNRYVPKTRVPIRI